MMRRNTEHRLLPCLCKRHLHATEYSSLTRHHHTMFTIRTITNDEDILSPPLRHVNFGGDNAVRTVSTRTRQAWLLLPDVAEDGESALNYDQPNQTFGKLARGLQDKSEDEIATFHNPDTATIHTALRDTAYWMWNHVFWDVSNFLGEVNCATGSFKPPAHSVIPVNYEDDTRQEGELGRLVRVHEMELDCHILIAPVFMDAGVTVRLLFRADAPPTITEEEIAGHEHSITFDASELQRVDAANIDGGFYNEQSIYWVKTGRKASVYLGGDYGKPRSGLAAVLVFGKYSMGNPALSPSTVEDTS